MPKVESTLPIELQRDVRSTFKPIKFFFYFIFIHIYRGGAPGPGRHPYQISKQRVIMALLRSKRVGDPIGHFLNLSCPVGRPCNGYNIKSFIGTSLNLLGYILV